MKRILGASAAFILVLGAAVFGGVPQGDSAYLEKGIINIRIFEGATDAGTPPSKTVTSSFTPANVTEKGGWDEDPVAQALRIQKAFNLASVVISSSSSMSLEKGRTGPAYIKFRIPKKADLSLEVTATDVAARKFKIEVFEQNDGTRSNLLSTEAGLPKETYTIFGFKDIRGNPYFISIQLGEWTVLPSRPVATDVALKSFGNNIQPPKLIKRIEPVYPVAARKAGVEGTVVLEATTDIYGKVASVKVLRSIPLLDQAAIDAVRQWVYEPMVIDIKPRGFVFTVTVRFDLKDVKNVTAEPVAPPIPAEGPVKAIGEIKPPELVKRVEPDYPPIAAEARVEGIVILEAMTDIYGRVKNVKVLRSIPLLDQAAMDAVRQWVYEPMIINGKPREVIFTVTVRFTLHGKRSVPIASRQMIPADGGEMMRVVSSVQPKYPEEARKAKAEGTVILEAAVDDKGIVVSVRVIRPVHPALDKAAEEALKEWKFEPRPLPLTGGFPAKKSVLLAAVFNPNPAKGQPEAVLSGIIGGAPGGVEGRVEIGVAEGVTGGVVGGVIKADLSDKAFEEGAALPPVRAIDDIQPPTLVKRVEPRYPETARQARVSGIVILEVTTDVYGKVQTIQVLRSIPLLDQAAIDAVKQWIYKPLLVGGKPRGCIFTVTVTFTLK